MKKILFIVLSVQPFFCDSFDDSMITSDDNQYDNKYSKKSVDHVDYPLCGITFNDQCGKKADTGLYCRYFDKDRNIMRFQCDNIIESQMLKDCLIDNNSEKQCFQNACEIDKKRACVFYTQEFTCECNMATKLAETCKSKCNACDTWICILDKMTLIEYYKDIVNINLEMLAKSDDSLKFFSPQFRHIFHYLDTNTIGCYDTSEVDNLVKNKATQKLVNMGFAGFFPLFIIPLLIKYARENARIKKNKQNYLEDQELKFAGDMPKEE